MNTAFEGKICTERTSLKAIFTGGGLILFDYKINIGSCDSGDAGNLGVDVFAFYIKHTQVLQLE